jgi:hypothetical protein
MGVMNTLDKTMKNINKTYWVTINHSHDTHYKVELKKHEHLTPEEVGKLFEKLFELGRIELDGELDFHPYNKISKDKLDFFKADLLDLEDMVKSEGLDNWKMQIEDISLL